MTNGGEGRRGCHEDRKKPFFALCPSPHESGDHLYRCCSPALLVEQKTCQRGARVHTICFFLLHRVPAKSRRKRSVRMPACPLLADASCFCSPCTQRHCRHPGTAVRGEEPACGITSLCVSA